MKGNERVQVLIDSMNVILYAVFEDNQECNMPKPQCHKYAISHQNPMSIKNTKK